MLKNALAARLNGEEVDLNKELAGNGEALSIEPIKTDTRDGLEVIRHSTAHLLAAAVLDLFPGTKLGVDRVDGRSALRILLRPFDRFLGI